MRAPKNTLNSAKKTLPASSFGSISRNTFHKGKYLVAQNRDPYERKIHQINAGLRFGLVIDVLPLAVLRDRYYTEHGTGSLYEKFEQRMLLSG